MIVPACCCKVGSGWSSGTEGKGAKIRFRMVLACVGVRGCVRLMPASEGRAVGTVAMAGTGITVADAGVDAEEAAACDSETC